MLIVTVVVSDVTTRASSVVPSCLTSIVVVYSALSAFSLWTFTLYVVDVFAVHVAVSVTFPYIAAGAVVDAYVVPFVQLPSVSLVTVQFTNAYPSLVAVANVIVSSIVNLSVVAELVPSFASYVTVYSIGVYVTTISVSFAGILSIVAVALSTLYPGSVGLTTDSLAPYLTVLVTSADASCPALLEVSPYTYFTVNVYVLIVQYA